MERNHVKGLQNCRLRGLVLFSVSTLLIVLPGCGGPSDQPDLGEVSGTVTLDGKPVPGINVLFSPDTGRPAGAKTDESGYYELVYLAGVNGCKVGPNTVTFEWEPGAENTVAIPERYSGTNGFKIDVKPGSQVVDLPMESK
jgi:hypothetical protein